MITMPISRDEVRVPDLKETLYSISGLLNRLARFPVEYTFTVHQEPDGYFVYPLVPGEADRGQVGYTGILVRDGRVFSYPLIVAHNHPNRNEPQPSGIDSLQLIAMTEHIQTHVPGARPLSIIAAYDGTNAYARIVQARKRELNFHPDMKIAARNWSRVTGLSEEQFPESGFYRAIIIGGYQFTEELFRISGDKLYHDNLPLEDALKQFEFGV